MQSCLELLRASKESKLDLSEFNFIEMGRYIALTVSGKDIRDNKLTDCIPTRNQGASLRLACRIGDQGELFDPAVRFPNEVEQRAMLGWALSTGVYKVISNHFYNFQGKTYKQGAGGAKGVHE